MAEEMVVLQCEKCATRLKVRAAVTKVMNEVKCPKCGGGVPARPASPGAPPPEPVADARLAEVERARAEAQARADRLEQELEQARRRIQELEAAPPPAQATAEREELERARRTLAEQDERLNQLQQLWYQKEREARAALGQVAAAQQQTKDVVGQLHGVLKEYHDTEIEAANARLAMLEERIRMFLAQPRLPG